MINTIDDMIKDLELIKKQHGNMFIRTSIQIRKIIEVEYLIEQFYNDNKTACLDVLIIKGYIDK